MNILITGAEGFIGSELVNQLKNTRHNLYLCVGKNSLQKNKKKIFISCKGLLEDADYSKITKNIDVILQTVYEPNYMSILHYPDWFKDNLRYTINAQFNDTIKPGKIRPAKDLLLKLTEHNDVEDVAIEHLDKIKRVLKLRGLDMGQVRKFKDLLEFKSPGVDWTKNENIIWKADNQL